MKTGFEDLDSLMMIRPGDFIIVGSRPAMGKSCLVRQIAMNVASAGDDLDVWLLDLHNSPVEAHTMLLSAISEVPRDKIGPIPRNAKGGLLKVIQENQEKGVSLLNGVEYQKIVNAANAEELKRVVIPSMETYKVCEELLNESDWPDLLVIDSLHMLTAEFESLFDVERMIKRIKMRAVEQGTVILATCDVSRNVEKRTGYRPVLVDISDSSAIEEVADSVIFISRRDYYDPNDKPGEAQIAVAKNRTGLKGDVRLLFRKELGLFSTWEPIFYVHAETDAFGAFNPRLGA